MRRRNRYTTGRVGNFVSALAMLALAGLIAGLALAGWTGTARAAASLSIEPITWGVIGLDGTDVNDGPNEFPVSVRVCNTGDAATPGQLSATFEFVTPNSRVALANASAIQTFPALAAGDCQDITYTVRASRSTATLDTTRNYTISVTDGTNTVSVGQQLRAEALAPVDTNTTTSIGGPAAVTVGTTATWTVEASTAPGGVPELAHFLTMCPDIFRLDSVTAVYSTPSGARDRLWADGCAWEEDNAGCGDGTVTNYGGTITYSYNVTILAAGECTLRSTVYDFSADAFHYNSDYGEEELVVTASAAAGGAQAQATPTPIGGTPKPTSSPTAGPSPTATTTPSSSIPTRTPAPGATPSDDQTELPATGTRARPGMLALAPPTAPAQIAFTWAVVITLLVGALLIGWSALMISGAISRQSAAGYGVWRALSVLFIVCALALAGMLAYNLIAAQQAARPAESSALPSGGVPEVFRPPDIPATQLIIPDLAIDTELTEAPRLGSSWDVSQFFEEIAHLEGTAYPGTSGNAVLAGHVHTTEGVGPFWNLRALQAGNMIIARGEGIEYRYQVEWVKVTDPDDDAVLAPADQPVLTLISCANWDRASWSYTERVVVRAALFDRAGVEEQPLPSPTPPVPSPFRG